MTLSKMTKTGLGMVVSFGITAAAPVFAQSAQPSGEGPNDEGLASASLADGEAYKAIQKLEAEIKAYPNDPALRINLGIAHAQAGNEAEARVQFDAAMASREVLELDTADGRTTDSRKLARQAIAMLERGEFRPASAQGEQFTLRD